MKILISILAAIATFILGFWLDGKFIAYVISVIPIAYSAWFGLIKIGLWILTFSVTFGLSLFAAYLVGGLVAIIIGAEL